LSFNRIKRAAQRGLLFAIDANGVLGNARSRKLGITLSLALLGLAFAYWPFSR
jgi:hypothetical protein